MPFKKIGKDKYETPSGRKYTENQMQLYYMTDGFKKMDKATKLKPKGKK